MAGPMNLLDRIIRAVSPQAYCRRMFWREEARYYDAARRDRFGENWLPPGSLSAENTDRPHRTLIRARARDLERNNAIVRGLLDGLERNVRTSTPAFPNAGPTGASAAAAMLPARSTFRNSSGSICAAPPLTATCS